MTLKKPVVVRISISQILHARKVTTNNKTFSLIAHDDSAIKRS